MSIKDFENLLIDTFDVDLCEPKSVFHKDILETYSYTKWAIKELLAYVIEYVTYFEPETVTDKNIRLDLIWHAVEQFTEEMETFLMYDNPCTKKMFSIASDIGANTYDILSAME